MSRDCLPRRIHDSSVSEGLCPSISIQKDNQIKSNKQKIVFDRVGCARSSMLV
jgi:hypothetical protein